VTETILHLLVGGLSYRTAPLALRERLAVPARDVAAALHTLRAGFGIDEAVLLSTCNRVELYVTSPRLPETREALIDFLSHQGRLSPDALQPRLSFSADGDAARHLFRVAAGLDSMVLGESEITAQVKQAYLAAQAHGATGPVLHRLFQKALHSAKLIRSSTRVGEGTASIGSVVVTLARQVFGGELSSREVLLWGAGKAAEATANEKRARDAKLLSDRARTTLCSLRHGGRSNAIIGGRDQASSVETPGRAFRVGD